MLFEKSVIELRLQRSSVPQQFSQQWAPSSRLQWPPAAPPSNGPPAVLPEMGPQQLFELSSTHDVHLFFPFCLSRFAPTPMRVLRAFTVSTVFPLRTHMTLTLSRY